MNIYPNIRRSIENLLNRAFTALVHEIPNYTSYAGLVLIGSTISALQTIPPWQEEVLYAGQCSSQCTAKAIPPEGVKVICGSLHAHLTARKMTLRHIRDGIEQKTPFEDNHYDFNYQIFRYLPEEITVLPGDELITECRYNTEDRTEATFGGEGTLDEMCATYVRYYPKLVEGWSECSSNPSYETYFNALDIESVSYG